MVKHSLGRVSFFTLLGAFHTASKVTTVAYSPDGKHVVSSRFDGTFRLWDVQTGKLLKKVGEPLENMNSSVVYKMAYSPNGKHVISYGAPLDVYGGIREGQLWDIQTGEQIASFEHGHGQSITAVAFTTDGQRFVSGSADGTLQLWDVQTNEEAGWSSLESVGELIVGHGAIVTTLAYSPDEQHFVSASDDGTLRLWDAQTNEVWEQPLAASELQVAAVAYSPDGRRLVSGGADGTLRLWDAQTGEPVGQPFPGHEGRVSTVAYSLDGQRLVSGGADGTSRLWDAQTGEPVGQPFPGHEEGGLDSGGFRP